MNQLLQRPRYRDLGSRGKGGREADSRLGIMTNRSRGTAGKDSARTLTVSSTLAHTPTTLELLTEIAAACSACVCVCQCVCVCGDMGPGEARGRSIEFR